MTARSLLNLFDLLYLLSLVSLGFSLALAGFHLHKGDRPRARSSATFGSSAASLALASFTSGVLVMPEYRGGWAFLQILLLLALVLACLALANAPDQALTAKLLPLLLLALPLILFLLFCFAARPSPTTPGIVEPPLRDRLRRTLERSSTPPHPSE